MHAVTPVSALIGRDREMALLTGLMVEAARGRGRAVLVEGEPGIGKSALVRAAVVQAPEAGCEVFWGAGDELSQALPLLPFLDGLRVCEPSADPRRKVIAQLRRGEIAAERTDVPVLLAEQLLALIAEQCEARPTVVVVDDLQWADQASITLWGRLARAAPQLPLLLVGMMRPVPQRDELMALHRAASDAARIQLAGLTNAAVADLVAALVGGQPDDNLRRLADGAAGNPLYVTELVASLVRSSNLTVTEAGAVELANGFVPGSLSAAIADRLGFVTGPVRKVLRAAALLGAEFAVSDLAAVLHRNVPGLIPAVDEAQAAGVLAESGHGLGFRHPLIRTALYDEISAPVRAAWHRDAGRALAAAGAPADRVARQLLYAVGADGAAEPMEEWILTWLASAADPLVRQAPQVAAELLGRAVASSPVGSAQHGRLVARLADALWRAGDQASAEQIASQALAHAAEPDLVVDLNCTLAQCRMRAGQAPESLATLNRALAHPGISARHRARLLVFTARTYDNVGELEKAGQIAASALQVASEADDTWAMGWSLHVLTLVTALQGSQPDALPLFDQALTVTQSDPALRDLRLLLQINKAVALGDIDQHEEALAAATRARDLADEIGMAPRIAQAHSALAQLLFDTGRWDEALAETQAVQVSLKEPGAVCTDLGIAAQIRFHRGETAAARRHLTATNPYVEQLGPRRMSGQLQLARSLDREQNGAPRDALAILTHAVTGGLEEREEIEDLLPDAVRLAVATGDQNTAQEVARHALADGSEIPRRRAAEAYCRGLLDHAPSQLLAAAEHYDNAGRPLQRAKALEAAAVQFIDVGDRDQARAAFTRAAEAYTSLGATADVARLQAAFRAHGIRRGPRAQHRRARSGWDSLTPAEVSVAAFVEEGLSNPEIAARLLLSPRTVASHVSSILKKLGVHTRAEIARESALRSVTAR